MHPDFYYCLFAALIIFFGTLIYLLEKKNHKEIMARHNLYFDSIAAVKKEITGYKEAVEEYRKKYIENSKDYSSVHEHLNQVVYQTALLKKGYRILRQAVIKKKVIQTPEQIKKNIIRTQERKKLLTQIKGQLEDLNGKTNRKVS